MKLNLYLQHLNVLQTSARSIFLCQQYYRRKTIVKGKPQLTEEQLSAKFIDERKVILQAGNGGDGRSGFLRDKNTEYGGPFGGNGGRGGDIIFISNHNVKGLTHVLPYYAAKNGKDGGSHDLYGRNGETLQIELPIGSLIRSYETLEIIADFSKDQQNYLVCAGGEGGKGNKFFVSSTNTTPMECTPGLPGEKMVVLIELRTLAHAGLVGFPNAGKSTMLRTLSRAKPAVSPIPFTTLVPHVGILHYDDFVQIAIADTPGIVEGAHHDKGLGIRFLRHIERCRFIIFVIDMSVSDPTYQLDVVLSELELYDESLIKRPGLILANKIDLSKSLKNFEHFCDYVEICELPYEVLPISGKMGTYLEDAIDKIRALYNRDITERKRYGKTIALDW